MYLLQPRSPLFPYTTLFRSVKIYGCEARVRHAHFSFFHCGSAPVAKARAVPHAVTMKMPQSPNKAQGTAARPSWTTAVATPLDRKSTRLNSSHLGISYAVFC